MNNYLFSFVIDGEKREISVMGENKFIARIKLINMVWDSRATDKNSFKILDSVDYGTV